MPGPATHRDVGEVVGPAGQINSDDERWLSRRGAPAGSLRGCVPPTDLQILCCVNHTHRANGHTLVDESNMVCPSQELFVVATALAARQINAIR